MDWWGGSENWQLMSTTFFISKPEVSALRLAVGGSGREGGHWRLVALKIFRCTRFSPFSLCRSEVITHRLEGITDVAGLVNRRHRLSREVRANSIGGIIDLWRGECAGSGQSGGYLRLGSREMLNEPHFEPSEKVACET